MVACDIEELRRRNAELCERLDQLRALLDDVFEPRMLDIIGPQTRSRLVNSMTGAEVGPHLREVALRCQALARDSTDARAAQALEEIGSELADRAGGLEAVFAIPDPMRSP